VSSLYEKHCQADGKTGIRMPRLPHAMPQALPCASPPQLRSVHHSDHRTGRNPDGASQPVYFLVFHRGGPNDKDGGHYRRAAHELTLHSTVYSIVAIPVHNLSIHR